MKLKNKVLLAIGIAWLLFFGLTYIGSKTLLLQSFLHLEQTRAEDNLSRTDQALDQVDNSLFTFTLDWAHWNDLYAYVQGKNPSFIENNVTIPALINAHADMITFWDAHEKMLYGISIDTNKQKIVELPQGIQDYLQPDSILFQKKDIRGYALTKHGIMLIAAGAATDGDKQLPPLGTLITGRYLDRVLLDKIAQTTKLNLEILALEEITNSSPLTSILNTLTTNTSGHLAIPVNDDVLAGYSIIKDINNKPIGMLRISLPRSIYQVGIHAINYYLAAFLTLGLLFSLLMILLLRALVVKRIEYLNQQVTDIGANNSLQNRVNVSGNDELSSLSLKVNHMLDIIQASHDQLENRVNTRTHELKIASQQLQQEISERKSVEQELVVHKEHLARLAHYDHLTGLPNRVFFNEVLNKSIENARQHNKMLGILFIDLDRFKNINDALGHPIGDLVLKEMGERFKNIICENDTLARLGGDEFIILLSNIDHPNIAEQVAEKILHACSQSVSIPGHEFFITASIGISIFPEDGQSLEDLQKNAGMAMYKAKHAGGAVYMHYAHEMDTAAHEYIKLEAALRKAIQNKEFSLFFQPQLKLSSGLIQRLEALIRWDNPELGLVSPAKFIPLAEKTGLIMPIGEWAIDEACRLNKQWQEEGYDPISIAVNISPKQFHHQDVAKLVAESLQKYNLPPHYLEIEITESTVMDNLETTINKLNRIHAMGVSISIDDFGAGYTSINYLRQFPVNVLKIDQTFIKGIPNQQNDAAITSAIIALGHSLGLEVIAEGVETTDQLQYLAKNHCDYIQGYFISPPLPEEKIILHFTKNGMAQDTIFDENK